MSYDTIEARGQVIRTSTLGVDEWANKRLDVRNGNGITVLVDDATDVRNVGVKGLYQGDGFIFSITNTGGPVTFDNVYLGDGANKSGSSHPHGPGGVFYHKKANCDVRFQRMCVEGYPNNGWYCSNTADGGSVVWDHCLGANNGVSSFRCGSPRDKVVNCTAYNDNTDYATSYGHWGGYTEDQGRPVWVWPPGGATIENCNLDAGAYSNNNIFRHNGANAHASGISSNHIVPTGVPRSAEEAASGADSGYGEGGYGEGGYGDEYGNGGSEIEDPFYISGPEADDWATRFTVNMVGSAGEFRLLASDDIAQGYWWVNRPDDEYIEGVEFTETDSGHWLVEGDLRNDTCCLVTQGDVVALEIEAPEFQIWRNGDQLTLEDFPTIGEFLDEGRSCEERLEEVKAEKAQLEDQLAEYEESIAELDEALATAEEKAPHFNSAFEYLRSLLP